MKRILILIILLLCMGATAQTVVVRDNATREAIQGAIITDKNKAIKITDARGRADVAGLDSSEPLTVYHPSFNSTTVSADGHKLIEVNLSSKAVTLDEIVLSANRSEEKKSDVPYSISIIDKKNIEFANQPTSADLLQNSGAVFVQKSQLGGGSPVLRGFEANKVLLVVDGVRMNNAIYRGGHLQDVITLDANMLERVEVLFGPASTVYGSDALGGVMHFYTKNAEFSRDSGLLVKGNSFARFASVNNETTAHADFNLGWKNFAAITNVTYSKFGDLRSGTAKFAGTSQLWDRNYYAQRFGERDSMLRNPDNKVQTGSGYEQADLMQRFSMRTGAFITHNLNLQYSHSGNINRYDRLSEMKGNALRFAEWYYGPQKRLLAAYTLSHTRTTAFSDNIRLVGAYQRIDQDRVTRSFGSNTRTMQMEDVKVYSFNADVFKRLAEEHELRYGAELTVNDVQSSARSVNIITGVESPAKTRYADAGNTMQTMGIYFSHSWELSESFIVSDGIRFTANRLESIFRDTTFFKFPFTQASQSNKALTGNLGFTLKEENNYKLSVLANSGFRTPNVDDLSKVFDSRKDLLIVPNPDLRPEYAYNLEFSLSKVFEGKYKFDVTAWYTFLDNVMVIADYRLNGQDSVYFQGVKSKVVAMQNKNSGYIYGYSAGLQFDLSEQISFKSSLNYTYGRYADKINDTLVPLDHIPPVFGQSSLLFRTRSLDAEFFLRFNGEKASSDYSLNGEDNEQYSADPVNGYMPAWFTLNFRMGVNLTRNLRVNGACENITDNYYRVFASGINAPGRNFIVSLRYKF